MAGDITNFARDKLKITGTAADAIEFAEAGIKAVSSVVGAVNTVVTILKALGIFDSSDAVQAKLDQILTEFKVVFETQQAEDQTALTECVNGFETLFSKNYCRSFSSFSG